MSGLARMTTTVAVVAVLPWQKGREGMREEVPSQTCETAGDQVAVH